MSYEKYVPKVLYGMFKLNRARNSLQMNVVFLENASTMSYEKYVPKVLYGMFKLSRAVVLSDL